MDRADDIVERIGFVSLAVCIGMLRKEIRLHAQQHFDPAFVFGLQGQHFLDVARQRAAGHRNARLGMVFFAAEVGGMVGDADRTDSGVDRGADIVLDASFGMAAAAVMGVQIEFHVIVSSSSSYRIQSKSIGLLAADELRFGHALEIAQELLHGGVQISSRLVDDADRMGDLQLRHPDHPQRARPELVGDGQVGDDRGSQVDLDHPLDLLAAGQLHHDIGNDAVLGEDAVDEAPAERIGRQHDQRNVLQLVDGGMLELGQRMRGGYDKLESIIVKSRRLQIRILFGQVSNPQIHAAFLHAGHDLGGRHRMDCRLDQRELVLEVGQHPRQNLDGDGARRPEHDMALRDMVQVGQLLLQLFDDGQDAHGMVKEHLSPVRQSHRLVAVYQHRLEFLLQALDLGRYGRLGQVELLPGLAEAHRLGDGEQRFELADIQRFPSF
ncbi:hypothetical protein BN871_AL_00090 [Paenibacillus sp. P22]|nr:hypothetical protein BN871_AL_00090 [Paenibacillus sp. P22]